MQRMGTTLRLHPGIGREPTTRAQRASAPHDDRLQELWRDRALVLQRLGRHEGRWVAEAERMEVRLRHVLPEGQDERHLLWLRALALSLRRTRQGRTDSRKRAHASAIPVA